MRPNKDTVRKRYIIDAKEFFSRETVDSKIENRGHESTLVSEMRAVMDTRIGDISSKTPPSKSGDWNINDTTLIENSVLIINGSIIINETGKLILKNSQIYMNLSYDGEHRIDVYGNLTMYESKITALNIQYNYYIDVYENATLKIEGSEISYAGYTKGPAGKLSGLWINTDNASINNSVIHHNYYGVYLNGSQYCEIKNTAINDIFSTSIFLFWAVNNTVFNCSFVNSGGYIIYSFVSFYNNISKNKIINGTYGIYLSGGDRSNIKGNTVQGCKYGTYIGQSQNNILEDNVFINCGLYVYKSYNNTVNNNTVNGKALIYLENTHDSTITEAGQVVLVQCRNIKIKNINISNVVPGIELFQTNNTLIEQNNIVGGQGIYIRDSEDNIIQNNTIKYCEEEGTHIVASKNISITGNIISNTKATAINIESSDHCNVKNSIIENSQEYGIRAYLSPNLSAINNTLINHISGIALYLSSDCCVINNNISEDQYNGIYISNAHGVTVIGNTIYKNSQYGIYLWSSSNATIVKNNMYNNTDAEIYIWGASSDNKIYLNNILGEVIDEASNMFDNGTYGNYWGITGPDENYDWIIDEEYQIDSNSIDHKPLLYPIDPYIYPNEDIDGDLLKNSEEKTYGTNPYSTDTDNDELTDFQETNIYHTDPHTNDTDNDGMVDNWEVTYETNPFSNDTQGDIDNDGLSNWEEYIYGTDPRQADTDRDGLPDQWEVTNGLDPTDYADASSDQDNDGLTNIDEYQIGTDPAENDTDSDGMPDGWEVTYGLDPLTSDASQDLEGDGLTNLEEYQQSTNPVVADTDSDGMPDGWEVTYGLNPTNSSDARLDSDQDGLINRLEFIYGTDPTNKDTGGDGYDDGVEIFHGSNPLDSSDYPVLGTVTQTMTQTETETQTITTTIQNTVSSIFAVTQTVIRDTPLYFLGITSAIALSLLALLLLRKRKEEIS